MVLRTIFLLIFFPCFFNGTGQSLNKNSLKVLVVTDDREFNRPAFFSMLDELESIYWEEISQAEVVNLYGTDMLKRYDALLFYDMPEKVILSDTQKQNMLQFFEDGAPAVFLHHSLLSYWEWDQFQEIIGGRYYNKGPFITSAGDSIQSVYEHDVRYKVFVAGAEHPVTRNIDDFEILDEAYNNYVVNEDVEVLLTTDHPSSEKNLAWVNTYGNSQIVYLMNGHNESAYNNPNFRKLLENALKWVASEKAK